jgi:oligopeptidase A
MVNPLLEISQLPRFAAIKTDLVEPAIRELLDAHRAQLRELLEQPTCSWDSLVVPLEEMQHRLSRTWSPVGHLNGVANSDELRAAYNACLPLLTVWHTELGQNEKLYRAYESILANQGATLSAAQRKLLENALRDFRLSGVALDTERKQQFKELMQKLATTQAKFDENVLDSTNTWVRHVADLSELEGLPASVIDRAAASAKGAGETGWRFTLDAPNYQAVMMHSSHPALRREFYEAWVTRASDQGPLAGRWDNSPLMEEILGLRHQIAQLTGFENYAQYSLASKMAKSTGEVQGFLERLAGVSRNVAQRELDDLTAFAGHKLEPWDVAFYSERLKQQRFSLSEEALRPYFPLPRVLEGLFSVASRLYGISIARRTDVETYHPDVQYYDILEANGAPRGGFFIDLYARPKKRGGAWMDECVGRKHLGAASALPIAYLVCNFTPPSANRPSLLTHTEVVTMFHEFGHGLHHMLTRVDYPSIAGINGVAWDAVELPSQFMENFSWRPEVLPLISGHVDTGEPLPHEDLARLLGSRKYQAAMQSVRQIEFALFDLRIHAEYDPASGGRIAEIIGSVRDQVAVLKPPAFNRFPQSFQHIFSGGYAAGYYSYKWAEVLAADAFGAFEESGVFNEQVATRFRSAILETGGSRDAMDAFIAFRGREPQIEPLLKQLGLAA